MPCGVLAVVSSVPLPPCVLPWSSFAGSITETNAEAATENVSALCTTTAPICAPPPLSSPHLLSLLTLPCPSLYSPLSPAPFQSVPLALNPPIALAPVKRPTHAQGSSSQLVQASDDMVLQISPPYRPSLHKAIVMVYLWCVCADSVHALFLPLAIHSTRIGNFKPHLRVGSRACQGARSVASKFPYKSEADFALSVTNSGSSDAR